MTRVGIHAPYSRQEATHLGLTLASLAERLVYDVDWLSSQAHETQLHPAWDGRVLSGRKRSFTQWARKHRCGHLIWFDVQPEKLELARKRGCSNTLVLLWHRLEDQHVPYLSLFDRIVCPSFSVAQAFQKRFKPLGLQNVRYLPWDTGTERRMGPQQSDETSVFLPLDGYTADKAGSLILHNAELLLASRSDITITVGHGKNWSREAMDALRRLQAARPQRVFTLKRRNWLEWTEAQSAHHWTLLPTLRCNTGYQVLDSLCLGVPVMAFDLPPISDSLHSSHGVLMPCNLTSNWLGATTAVFSPRVLLSTLEESLNPDVRRKLLHGDWSQLDERRRQFNLFWDATWGA